MRRRSFSRRRGGRGRVRGRGRGRRSNRIGRPSPGRIGYRM